MYKKIIAGALAILVIALLVILYLVVARSRHEREGDSYFERDKFDAAIEKYSRALAGKRFFGKGRADYKIGLCYERLDDTGRAMDIYYGVIKAFPESTYALAARKRIEEIFHEATRDPADISDVLGGPSTPLTRAHKDVRKRYLVFIRAVRENKSGVSGALREAYGQYKLSYKIYRDERQKALDHHREKQREERRERQDREANREVERIRRTTPQPGRLGEDGVFPLGLKGR